MTKNSKIRLTCFIISALLLTAAVVGYSYTLRELTDNFSLARDGEISIDGADFTFFGNLISVFAMGLVMLTVGIVYFFTVSAEALIPALILRLAGVRKNSLVSGEELKITKNILAAFTAFSFIAGLLAAGITGLFAVFFICIPMPLIMYAVYYRGLKKQYSAQGELM